VNQFVLTILRLRNLLSLMLAEGFNQDDKGVKQLNFYSVGKIVEHKNHFYHVFYYI